MTTCVLTVLLLAAACGGPVEVTPTSPPEEGRDACDRLLDRLPDRVADQPRRDVDPPSASAAAWGDPAIVLRCGVRRPAGFDEFSTCQETDGIGWFIPEAQVERGPGPITMTTIDRTPRVQVQVPTDYWPPATAMVDLAEAIEQAVPRSDPCV